MEEKLRNLLALKVEDARSSLEEQGFSVELVETAPPDKEEGQGKRRVIAIREASPGVMIITWSYENYI